MFKSYLKIAVRNLLKHRTHSFINVAGLAVGFAASLLIGLYVQYELSYDRFHRQSSKIYRIVASRHYNNGNVLKYATTSPPLAPALRAEYPEIARAVRFFSPQWTTQKVLIRCQENKFYEERFFFGDPEVLEVFSLPLAKGDPQTALQKPHAVILTEQMANKYFGGQEPLGKQLLFDNRIALEVTGVLKNLPSHTHLKIDFIAPFAVLEEVYGPHALNLWGWELIYTYILLQDHAQPEALAAKLPNLFDKYTPDFPTQRGYQYSAELQPLVDIHLHSNRLWEIEPNSHIAYIYALVTVAIFILLIACVNFVNLTTAQATERVMEVGLRKVLGAQRRQLVAQFLGESLVVSFAAILLAIGAAELALPWFNALTGRSLALQQLTPGQWALIGAGTMLLMAGAAGSYPAFLLARSWPTHLLQKKGGRVAGSNKPRHALVVLQFTLGIGLITATLVVYQQLDFFQNRNLGFDKEQVLAVRVRELGAKLSAFKEALVQRSEIESVSAASGLPGGQVERMRVRPEDRDELMPVSMLWVDHEFIRTLGIDLVAGRDFSRVIPTDTSEAFIINETAARAFGWQNPVGKRLLWPQLGGVRQGLVIGVAKDFHFTSLHHTVEPMVLLIQEQYRYLLLRASVRNLPAVAQQMQQQWQTFVPDQPLEYSFLDEAFNRLYDKEDRLGKIFSIFAGLAVTIASLGLFGLAALTAKQRTKEIGVRKVLGATVTDVVALLSKDFVKLVLLSNLVAAPVAYFAMNKWLQDFAYRIDIDLWVFVLAGGMALLIALATVSTQAIKAALANPVEALRYE